MRLREPVNPDWIKSTKSTTGSYHPCSCRLQTSAHSLCCSTAEPCWPVSSCDFFFRYLPPTWCSLPVLIVLGPPEVSPAREERKDPEFWREQKEREGSLSLCLAEWKIKIAAPSLSSLSQFTAVKTYLEVGVDIPPGERRLSQAGLLWHRQPPQ